MKQRGGVYEFFEEADGVVVGVGEEVVQPLRLCKLLQMVQHVPAHALVVPPPKKNTNN